MADDVVPKCREKETAEPGTVVRDRGSASPKHATPKVSEESIERVAREVTRMGGSPAKNSGRCRGEFNAFSLCQCMLRRCAYLDYFDVHDKLKEAPVPLCKGVVGAVGVTRGWVAGWPCNRTGWHVSSELCAHLRWVHRRQTHGPKPQPAHRCWPSGAVLPRPSF